MARLRFGSSKLNPTFSSLLSWLALIDTLFLVFISLTFSLPSLSHEYKKWIFPVLLPSTLPLTSIFLTGNDILLLFFVRNKKIYIFDVVIFQFISASLYMVVATSIERFLQLNHPRFSNKVETNNKRVLRAFLFNCSNYPGKKFKI